MKNETKGASPMICDTAPAYRIHGVFSDRHGVHVDHLHRPIKMTNGAKATVWDAVWLPPLALATPVPGAGRQRRKGGGVHSITDSATMDACFPGAFLCSTRGRPVSRWFQLPRLPVGFPQGSRKAQSEPLALQLAPQLRSNPIRSASSMGQTSMPMRTPLHWGPSMTQVGKRAAEGLQAGGDSIRPKGIIPMHSHPCRVRPAGPVPFSVGNAANRKCASNVTSETRKVSQHPTVAIGEQMAGRRVTFLRSRTRKASL